MEFQSLSASVNRIVQDEAANGMTVEEEVDSQSLDKMSIDTTFDLKQKIDGMAEGETVSPGGWD